MGDFRPTKALYVDGVPVLFGDDTDDGYDGDRWAWLAPLGDRAEGRPYDGPFPLTGDDLAESLRVLAESVDPIVPNEMRGTAGA